MIGLLVVTHGDLGRSLLDSIAIIAGEVKNAASVDFTIRDYVADLVFIEKPEDEVDTSNASARCDRCAVWRI